MCAEPFPPDPPRHPAPGTPVTTRLTISRKSLQIILMIICVCRGLNTSKVTDAIAAGARSPRAVHAHHDTTINCGKCCETVCGMIRETQCAEAERASALVAAE
ncbi:MAG: hypothetical protein GC155_01315 [Alphaproteobacteria bacterium]|nr:hypothetical protein [Alphaproteobacteria bacterium]